MGKPAMSSDTPTPPAGLKAEGRRLWTALQAEYRIVDAGGLQLLRMAAQCADLARDAMQQAQTDGLSSIDRYGQRRPHPLLSVARDARGQILAALRAMNLDVEPLHDRPGRPTKG